MTREEEYKRLIEDRDEAEDELIILNEEVKEIEINNSDFEDLEIWNDLFSEITELENKIMYIDSIIDSEYYDLDCS